MFLCLALNSSLLILVISSKIIVKNLKFILDNCLYYRRFSGNDFHSEYSAHSPCFIFIGSSDFFDISCFAGLTWAAGTVPCHLHEFQGLRGWSSTATGYNFVPSILISPYITTCGTERMFGGYGKFGQGMELTKIFDVLPTHTSVQITFSFFKIDSWDAEIFEVWVDGVSKFSKAYNFNTGAGNLCGWANYPENMEAINIQVSHSATTLTIKMKGYVNGLLTDESWGIRDFNVYIVNSCTGGCLTCNIATPSVCLSCPIIAELISGKCVCADHFYMKTSDFVHCAICHYSCNTCNGPLETNCQSCFADHKISSGKCVPDTSNRKKKKKILLFYFFNFLS